ncbi:mannitol dehydrogenase family protein [Solemya velum gill symbiont]|uniref:mannitol dehydrogenase family protein n=1 Tax=Solemya velum gill symbiont TaxID=2340 RepID=UPI000997E914|nr:mannitol dehydrogenase family protein [Solemya velum gill symbiont]OOY91688.1 mannitol dehydrogenase [Solemya velum gill symbiont]
MTKILNNDTLGSLPSSVSVPRYDRGAITPGILHIGVGNFHRAHQGVYLDRLFNKGLSHDWGIIGAGIMQYDAAKRELLSRQDWLSTVIELDPRGYTARVCGSMIDFAEISSQALVRAMMTEEIRIVSLTITEGGYYIDPETGGFNANHPDIRSDAANGGEPGTVFGAIVTALKIHQSAGMPGFTVMSCDNLPHNGDVTRRAVLGMAELIAPELSGWIEENVTFPNGMVDCITPATGDRERAMVEEKFGIDDPGIVVCEPFRQWILEDNFCQGRPALEEVGVEFVQDVSPYELMKLRILNGGHAAIAYPSALLGVHYAHDAMGTPLVQAFLERLETEEIIPTVPPVPGVDFNQYLDKTQERFSNAEIGDTIPRLCLDGSNRQPKFILPTIADRLEQGLPVNGLALEVALWCRYCAGTDDSGKPLSVDDEKAERLQKNAQLARSEPKAFLGMSDIFGNMGSNEAFVSQFSDALGSLWENGTEATLQSYVSKVA